MVKLYKNWRLLLLLGAVVLFSVLVWQHQQELVRVKEVLLNGCWVFFIIGLFMQILFYVFQSFMYEQILKVWTGISFKDTFKLTLLSSTANKLVPSGGVSGLLAFTDRARQEGVDAELSLIGNIWFYLLDYLSFLILVWLGTIWYAKRIGLNFAQKGAVAGFSLVIVLVLAGFLLAVKHAAVWENRLGMIKVRNSLLVKMLSAGTKVLGKMKLIEAQWQGMRTAAVRAFGGGLAMQLADVAILYLCFLTIRYPVDPGTVVAGFGLSSVLALVSMVPQGIGIYEAAMTWVYIQMGIPFSIAITVALLYRGITFWFAIVPGLFAIKGGRKKRK